MRARWPGGDATVDEGDGIARFSLRLDGLTALWENGVETRSLDLR